MATTRRIGRIAGLAVALGGALLIGAGFLPWAAAAVRGGTTTTVGGWSLDAVRVGAALGAVLVVVGVAMAMVMNPVWRRVLAAVSVAAALVAGGIAVYHLSARTGDVHAALRQGATGGGRHANQTTTAGRANGGQQRPASTQRGGRGGVRTPGAGVWIALAGGLIAVIGGMGTLAAPGDPGRPVPGAAHAVGEPEPAGSEGTIEPMGSEAA